MAHYIDKDALVAEIEKLKGKVWDGSSYCNGWQHALRMLELSLNTLEVKEVDLEKEITLWANAIPEIRLDVVERLARHFYELGLETQRNSISIPNIDDLFEEDGIDPDSKTAKIFKESYYIALEKLKEMKGK